MHKENCTVDFVMFGRGLNMSVIYNSGLLSTSTTSSGLAPRPCDPRVTGGGGVGWGGGHVVPTAEQNGPWCRCTHKRRRCVFIYALLGFSGDAEATFREKRRGEGPVRRNQRLVASIAEVYFHAFLELVSHLETSAEGEYQTRLWSVRVSLDLFLYFR